MPRIMKKHFNESEVEGNASVPDLTNLPSSSQQSQEYQQSQSSQSVEKQQFVSSADDGNIVVDTSTAAFSAVRSRRGRRVTRNAGAAGEAMELTVEDSRSHNAEPHTVAPKPITSLLFQEPVLPKRASSDEDNNSRLSDDNLDSRNNRDSQDSREDRGKRGGRGNRGERDDLNDDSRNDSRSRRSNRNYDRNDRNDRNDRGERNDRNSDRSSSRNNRKSRSENRMNDNDFDLTDRDSDRGERNDRNDRNNDKNSDRNDNRNNSRDLRRRNRNHNREDYDNSAELDSNNAANNALNNNSDNFEDDAYWYQDKNNQPRKNQRSRRSRRLNAVERRAAAEVEQIEEDLAYDDIVYAPIDTRIDETLDFSDILSADNGDSNRRRRRRRGSAIRDDFDRENADRNNLSDSDSDSDYSADYNSNDSENVDRDSQEDAPAKSRRRAASNRILDEDDDNEGMVTRRRRSSRADRNADRDSSNSIDEDSKAKINKEDLDAVSQEDRDLIPDPDEFRAQDEEETLYTRRRRRRRSKSSDDTNSQTSSSSSSASRLSVDDDSPRRSRKQQYIDEITDIEGSTRLEAKRQRRRDNRRERARQNLLMEQDFLARRENVERLMVVRERDRHTQISVIEDNILVEHYVSDIQEVATVGNIYLGRIQNVLPSMEAAFVDIGQARNGVLYAGEVNWDMTRLEGQPRRIELAFKSGDPVLVQVTKDPIGHKGARLTSQVTLAGRFLVLVPSGGMTGVSRKLSDRERSRLRSIVAKIAPKDMGVIIRTAADGASEDSIEKDLESLIKQWERIEAKRQEYLHGKHPKLLQGEPDVAIRVVRDIFNDDFQKLIVEGVSAHQRINEYLEMMAPDLRSKVEYWDPAEHEGKDVFDKWQIDSQLRKGMERQVYLPAGGSIVIDRTEAMTTIDVNTGRFIGRGKSLEETVTRCNLEASEEIARQLRLRDIGGMVMIDYVDMVLPANRDLVLRRLLECLARDRTKHQVAEVTSLGLVQMTRKRVGQGLVEAFSEECPTCKGRGFILHDEPTVSSEFADPYALKGGDPFIKTNKHGHGSATEVSAPVKQHGSSAEVRAKLARIAAASAINEVASEFSVDKSEFSGDESEIDDGTTEIVDASVIADQVAETAGEIVETEDVTSEIPEVSGISNTDEAEEVEETTESSQEYSE